MLQLPSARFSKFWNPRIENSQVKSKSKLSGTKTLPSISEVVSSASPTFIWSSQQQAVEKDISVSPSLACKQLTSFISSESKNFRNLFIVIPFLVAGMKYLQERPGEGGVCLGLRFRTYSPPWQRRHGSRNARQLVTLHLQPANRAGGWVLVLSSLFPLSFLCSV